MKPLFRAQYTVRMPIIASRFILLAPTLLLYVVVSSSFAQRLGIAAGCRPFLWWVCFCDDNLRWDSSAPFRYDPNEVSVDDDLGTAESAIKNLNFSTIAREGGGSATSTRTRTGVSPDWMRADSEEPFTAFSGAAHVHPIAVGCPPVLWDVEYCEDEIDRLGETIDTTAPPL